MALPGICSRCVALQDLLRTMLLSTYLLFLALGLISAVQNLLALSPAQLPPFSPSCLQLKVSRHLEKIQAYAPQPTLFPCSS